MKKSRWHLSRYNISAKIESENTWYVANLYRATCVPMSAATLYAMSNVEELDEDHPLLLKLARLGLITDHDERAALESMARLACAFPHAIGLTICPTMGCNFDCPYCFEDHRPEKMSEKTMDEVVALAEKMLDVSGAKNLDVAWFGGEPLLAPDVIASLSERLIRICEERDIKYDAGIITNGYLLDQDMADMLEKYKVSNVQVTLDGVGEAHDRTRHLAGGGATFERITSNLRNTKLPFEVHVRHNVHSENKDQQQTLKEYVDDLAKESGNKIIYYASPVNDNKASFDRKSDITLMCDAQSADIGIMLDTTRMRKARGHFCGAHTLWSVAIDAEGGLHKCWETVDKKELRFGNVSEWSVANPIETASNADNLTSFLNTSGAIEDTQCRECIWLPVCRGGCPVKRLEGEKSCVTYKDSPEAFVRALYEKQKKLIDKKNDIINENDGCE